MLSSIFRRIRQTTIAQPQQNVVEPDVAVQPEIVVARPGHDLPIASAPMGVWDPIAIKPRVDLAAPTSLISSEEMGRHLDYLRRLDAANTIRNTSSHTTERCRYELLTYLLDTPGTGPVIEVGTMWGGLTCMFAYIAAVTGRRFYAVDIEPIRMNVTKETCEYFGLTKHITFFTGTLS